MKKNNIFKVVLFVVLIVVLCTWIFPTINIDESTLKIAEGGREQVGLFDIGYFISLLFSEFSNIILTVFSIGAFYGVAHHISGYRRLLDFIVEKFKGNENVFISVVIVLISVIISITGFQIGILFIFPFIISLILLMGYNKLVAASVTVGSTMVGLIGSTIASNTTQYVNAVLNVNNNEEMVTKIILLVLGMIILAINVIMYAAKTKNNTDKVLEYVPNDDQEVEDIVIDTKKENIFSRLISKIKLNKKKKDKKDKKETKKVEVKKETKKVSTTKKKPVPKKKSTKTKANDNKTGNVLVVTDNKKSKMWPFVVIFDVLFLILLVSVFDWEGILNATWAKDALDSIKEFEIGGFPIISKLLGTSNLGAFGTWYKQFEIPLVIFIFTGLLGFVYNMKFDKFINSMIEGIKKAVVPVMTIILAYLVLVICDQSRFQLQFINYFLNMFDKFNIFGLLLTSFTFMINSLLSVDINYVIPLYYTTTIITDTNLYPLLGVMMQAIYGLVMLVAPTSIVLIATLSYLEIPYTQWLKHIWKVFLELLAVMLIIFIIVFILLV